MKHCTVSEYRRLAYVGRAPCARTIIRWIQKGVISGEKIGGTWVVHVGEPVPPKIDNPLLDRMIAG